MRLSIFILFASAYIGVSLGGTLEVIDNDCQCLIWSVDNHGCSGYSESFGLLKGDDCSELSELVNGTRKDYSVLVVDACGTENGQPAAWILVNQTGLVTFSNQNGDESACTLDNGFKLGSSCNTSQPDPTISSHPSMSTTLPGSSSPLAKSTTAGCAAA